MQTSISFLPSAGSVSVCTVGVLFMRGGLFHVSVVNPPSLKNDARITGLIRIQFQSRHKQKIVLVTHGVRRCSKQHASCTSVFTAFSWWVSSLVSACGSREAGRPGGREAGGECVCLLRRIDRGFTETQRSPELLSRHRLSLCVPHVECVQEVEDLCDPSMSCVSVCWFNISYSSQRAPSGRPGVLLVNMNLTMKWDIRRLHMKINDASLLPKISRVRMLPSYMCLSNPESVSAVNHDIWPLFDSITWLIKRSITL